MNTALPDALLEAKRILQIVAEYTGVSEETIRGHDKHGEYRMPRRLAVWLIREHTKLPTSAVGRFLNNRDHSTIITLARRFEADMKQDRDLRQRADQLLASLSNPGPKKAAAEEPVAKYPRAV